MTNQDPSKYNEGAHFSDESANVVNTQFDNAAVATLMQMFDATTPKLLALYEKREFFTYFFLGPHTIPALTAKQAYDFKVTFGIRNFPANGVPAYMNWLSENGNDYEDAFLYPAVDENAEVINDTWKMEYIENMEAIFNDITENQSLYGNWMAGIYDGGAMSWDVAAGRLATDELLPTTKEFFAKVAGLFASGKFVTYYNNEVSAAISKATGGFGIFDPYTGEISIADKYGDEYTVPFDELKRDSYGNNLYYKPDETDESLPYRHRLFCLLCLWLSRLYSPRLALRNVTDENVKKNIKTYWDFSPPVQKKGKLPTSTGVNTPKVIYESHLMEYIQYLGKKFLEETAKINDGDTSYKDLWNGAKMKIGDGIEITCPFYYVIRVNFDTTSRTDIPFAGERLDLINSEIRRITAERDKYQQEIQSLFQNVTNMQSCVSSITDMSTTIFGNGSTDNTVIKDASCSFNTEKTETSNTEGNVNETQNWEPTVVDPAAPIETTFSMSNRNVIIPEFTDLGDDSGESGGSTTKKINNKTIIIGVAIVVGVILICLFIWLIARKKKSPDPPPMMMPPMPMPMGPPPPMPYMDGPPPPMDEPYMNEPFMDGPPMDDQYMDEPPPPMEEEYIDEAPPSFDEQPMEEEYIDEAPPSFDEQPMEEEYIDEAPPDEEYIDETPMDEESTESP